MNRRILHSPELPSQTEEPPVLVVSAPSELISNLKDQPEGLSYWLGPSSAPVYGQSCMLIPDTPANSSVPYRFQTLTIKNHVRTADAIILDREYGVTCKTDLMIRCRQVENPGWISIYNFDLLRDGRLAAMLLNLMARSGAYPYPLAFEAIKQLQDVPAIRNVLASYLRQYRARHHQPHQMLTAYSTTDMNMFYYNLRTLTRQRHFSQRSIEDDISKLVERIERSTDGLCSSTSM